MCGMAARVFSFLWLLLASGAGAHGAWDDGEQAWQQWNFSPWVLLSLIAMTVFYFRGQFHLARIRAYRQQVSRAQQRAFIAGLIVLVVALLSPVDTLSDHLAWVHMLQHSLLMMVAAPLIAWSSPSHLSLWSLPPSLWKRVTQIKRRIPARVRENLARPLGIWILYSVTLWLWHLPLLYEAALHDPVVHDFQHLSFFVTSFFFWKLVIDPFAKRNLMPALGLLYLFVTSMHAMVLGVLMTLSPVAWYAFYLERAPAFGLSALDDQRIAGLIMWMPAGATYVVVSIGLILKLVREPVARS